MIFDDERVLGLCDPDLAVRRRSAGELYFCGVVSTLDSMKKWTSDAEFASFLLCRENTKLGSLEKLGSGGIFNVLRCTVGIATRPDTFEIIRTMNGFPRLADVPPDQDAVEFELHFPADKTKPPEIFGFLDLEIDILTTKDPAGSGAIAKFLAKRGEDIQQVEYEVSDVDRATRILAEKFGVKAIYPATRPGANGTRVNFFLVTNPGGHKVLIELVEPARAK